MNAELSMLYQEVILDHNRYPRNHHAIMHASAEAEGYNPLCGDMVKVYLAIQDGFIQEASFMGSGCAISQASASMMTELLTGKSLAEAMDLFQRFHQLLTTDHAPEPMLDKLNVLAGVRHYPGRVKCATLAWHTFEAAMQHTHAPVSTE